MGAPELIFASSSVVQLPTDLDLARAPLHPNRKRSTAFMERFEHKILYYDCFRSATDNSVFLVGPPPLNLDFKLEKAAFFDGQTGMKLEAEHTISRSTLLTRLANIPSGTNVVTLEFADHKFEITIQRNLSEHLVGSNILFSMNKDNDLDWVQDWAHWHNQTQNADAVVLFDNGSTRYGLSALGAALEAVDGLKKIVLFDWPTAFGARDDRAWSYHYWAHFLQISSMNVVLRRCATKARGLANLDIDELATPLDSGTVFDLARSSKYGVAALAGAWVSAASHSTQKTRRHLDFRHIPRGPSASVCPKKWVLDPQTPWVDKVDVFPYWHRIMGAPDRKVTDKPIANFWHFKGISTNWKTLRTKSSAPSPLWHRTDANLSMAMAKVWPRTDQFSQKDN